MYLKFLFFIGCQSLMLTVTEEMACYFPVKNNPHLGHLKHNDEIGVDYCNPSYEKCCPTGCCKKENDRTLVWVIVILVGGAIISFLYFCCKRGYQAAEADPAVTRPLNPNRDDDEIVNLTGTPGRNRNQQIRIMLRQPEPSDPGGGSSQVTPPPSYEMAVIMPSVRIPLAKSEN